MTDFNSDEPASEVIVEQLKTIAESGDVNIEWSVLQRALKSRLDTVVSNYQERHENKQNENGAENQQPEPNVEKFNLDKSRDELMELLQSFSEPPFTIQRICELLYSPFTYYDRVSTFFRGLEKNLRVISSNDWPKAVNDGDGVHN